MYQSFSVTIRTPSSILFEGESTMLVLPGYDGVFSILANHEPIVAGLQKGDILLHLPQGDSHSISIDHGVLSMDDSVCSLLVHVE